eukprot:c11505_g1_i1 orf=465-926(-)
MAEENGAISEARVGVGVGVLLVKEGGGAADGRLVLAGRRRSSFGDSKFALPGGHLEFGESWEECAAREVLEETGLVIHKIQFAGVTNSVLPNEIRPFHYVIIYMQAELLDPSQEPQNCEPEKCDGWEWVEWPSVPQPVFEPLQDFIDSGYKLK